MKRMQEAAEEREAEVAMALVDAQVRRASNCGLSFVGHQLTRM